MSPEDFFHDFLENDYRNEQWSLQTFSNPDEEYVRKKFEAELDVINKEKIVFTELEDEIAFCEGLEGKGSFSTILNVLVKSLQEDIRICTQSAHDDLLEKCHIKMLPIGICEAFCTNFSDGIQLNGYAIGLNEGLYVALNLFTKALILESLQGDLSAYQASGTESFIHSLKLFINHDPKMAEKMLYWDLPADVHGEISGYQSLTSILILQFIGLHEFAHVVHNDFEIMDMMMMHMSQSEKIQFTIDPKQLHEREFEADAFALRALNARTPNHLSAWANFVAIYLYFHWLHYMLLEAGRLSTPTHPEPLKRAEALLEIMDNEIGGYDNFKHELDRIVSLTQKWYADYKRGDNHE